MKEYIKEYKFKYIEQRKLKNCLKQVSIRAYNCRIYAKFMVGLQAFSHAFRLLSDQAFVGFHSGYLWHL